MVAIEIEMFAILIFSQLPLAILSQITASCILKSEVQTTSGIDLGELINVSRVL